jgi:WD40 repeat protein
MHAQHPQNVLRGHQGAVYDLAWDGNHPGWVSAGGDGVVARWALGSEDGQALFHHAAPFFAVSVWNGDAVAGNSTGELFLKTGADHAVSRLHESPVFSLFVDAQNRLWSGDGSGRICRWERTANGMAATLDLTTGLGKIRSIDAHPEGILVAGGTGTWAVLNELGKATLEVQAHERSCYWARHLASKDVVLSGGQDGLLAVHRGTEHVLSLPVHQSAVYRGIVVGTSLWTASRDKEVKAWDVMTLEPLGKLPRPHTRSVNALALGGGDGTLLATGGDDRSAKVWGLT